MKRINAIYPNCIFIPSVFLVILQKILEVTMLDYPFFAIPHSLRSNPIWRNAKLAYKLLLVTIISRLAHTKSTYDDHGTPVEVNPGQILITEVQLIEWCKSDWGNEVKFDKNIIHRGKKYFYKYQIMNQKVNRKKMLITYTYPDIYEDKKIQIEPRNEPKVNQKRTKVEPEKKKEKKEKNEEEEKNIKKEKIAFREFVTLTQDEHKKLLDLHKIEKLNRMLDKLNSYKGRSGKEYKSDYSALDAGSWVLKDVTKEMEDETIKKPINESTTEPKFQSPRVLSIKGN